MLKPIHSVPKESRVLAVVVVTLLVQVLVLSLFGLAALRGQVAEQEQTLREISRLVLSRNLVDEMIGRCEAAADRAAGTIADLSVEVPYDPALASRIRLLVEREDLFRRAFVLGLDGEWLDDRGRVLRPGPRSAPGIGADEPNPFDAVEAETDPATALEQVRSLAARSDERFAPYGLRLIARLARAADRPEEALAAWGRICREYPTALDTLVFPVVPFGPQAARMAAAYRLERFEAGRAGAAEVIADLIRLREILSLNRFQLDDDRRRFEQAGFESLMAASHPRLGIRERVVLADSVRAVSDTEDALLAVSDRLGTALSRVARGVEPGGPLVTTTASGPLVVVATPITGPAGPSGVAVFELDLAGVRVKMIPAILDGLPLPDGVAATVRTAEGAPVAGPVPAEGTVLEQARLGETLPFWHAAVFLEDPDRLQRRIEDARLVTYGVMGLSIAGMLAAAWFLLRTVRREMRIAAMKSDFLSNVTHELKTPLTSIRMFVETLQEGRVKDEAERMEYLGVISREAERLSGLIQRVLDLARFEGRRKDAVRRRETDVASLLRDTAEIFRRRLKGEEAELSVSIPDELPVGNIDPESVREAVLNLLSNAEKYGGKSIRLCASVVEGTIAIEVTDDGIGIAEEEQGRIFTKFYRSEDTLARRQEGSGLGLALVREIAVAHGGRVRVTSRPGEGSTFVISLPVARRRS